MKRSSSQPRVSEFLNQLKENASHCEKAIRDSRALVMVPRPSNLSSAMRPPLRNWNCQFDEINDKITELKVQITKIKETAVANRARSNSRTPQTPNLSILSKINELCQQVETHSLHICIIKNDNAVFRVPSLFPSHESSIYDEVIKQRLELQRNP